jgi:hypothetical protein
MMQLQMAAAEIAESALDKVDKADKADWHENVKQIVERIKKSGDSKERLQGYQRWLQKYEREFENLQTHLEEQKANKDGSTEAHMTELFRQFTAYKRNIQGIGPLIERACLQSPSASPNTLLTRELTEAVRNFNRIKELPTTQQKNEQLQWLSNTIEKIRDIHQQYSNLVVEELQERKEERRAMQNELLTYEGLHSLDKIQNYWNTMSKDKQNRYREIGKLSDDQLREGIAKKQRRAKRNELLTDEDLPLPDQIQNHWNNMSDENRTRYRNISDLSDDQLRGEIAKKHSQRNELLIDEDLPPFDKIRNYWNTTMYSENKDKYDEIMQLNLHQRQVRITEKYRQRNELLKDEGLPPFDQIESKRDSMSPDDQDKCDEIMQLNRYERQVMITKKHLEQDALLAGAGLPLRDQIRDHWNNMYLENKRQYTRIMQLNSLERDKELKKLPYQQQQELPYQLLMEFKNSHRFTFGLIGRHETSQKVP